MHTRINKVTNIKTLPTLLPHSIDFANFFANKQPVDLEIGCGRPHFFYDRIKNFSHRNIVAMEWKYEFIEQAKRRIARENIKNACALHGNAWLLTPLLFSYRSIEQVFVNFPDPWWKTRHKKRLVLNEIFLTALAKRMKPEGFILLQTDVEPLFSFYQELINNHGHFYLDLSMSSEQIIEQTKAQTHREKKCQADGLAIYRGIFRLKHNF